MFFDLQLYNSTLPLSPHGIHHCVSVFTWMSFLRAPVIMDYGNHTTPGWYHYNQLHWQWPYFQIRSHLWYWGLGLQHRFSLGAGRGWADTDTTQPHQWPWLHGCLQSGLWLPLNSVSVHLLLINCAKATQVLLLLWVCLFLWPFLLKITFSGDS